MNKLGYALRRNPAAAVGIAALAAWVVVALVGPSVLRFGHTAMDMESQLSAPGLNGHALGTDALGRDILARIVYGSRSILSVALLTSLFSSIAGVALGFSAGYFGGKIDAAFMRFLDILMAIPPLVLSMVVLGALGDSSVGALTLIVSIAYTPATARVARSALLSCKGLEYVDAARLRGESHAYIMFVEILPNAIGPILVEVTARFAYSIMMIASLGFLGVGLQPPTPDWGMMVIENKTVIREAPWAVLYPSLAIASLVIAVSLISDFLAKALIHDE